MLKMDFYALKLLRKKKQFDHNTWLNEPSRNYHRKQLLRNLTVQIIYPKLND